MKDLLKSFFSFDEFITPKIIKAIFWLSVAGIVVGGLLQTFSAVSYAYGFFGSVTAFLMGIAGIILGIVGAKVTSELIMVMFKIAENTKK